MSGVNKTRKVKIYSFVSSRGQKNYTICVSLPWPPLEAALWIFKHINFVTNSFLRMN